MNICQSFLLFFSLFFSPYHQTDHYKTYEHPKWQPFERHFQIPSVPNVPHNLEKQQHHHRGYTVNENAYPTHRKYGRYLDQGTFKDLRQSLFFFLYPSMAKKPNGEIPQRGSNHQYGETKNVPQARYYFMAAWTNKTKPMSKGISFCFPQTAVIQGVSQCGQGM